MTLCSIREVEAPGHFTLAWTERIRQPCNSGGRAPSWRWHSTVCRKDEHSGWAAAA